MINAELLRAIDTEFETALSKNGMIKHLYAKVRDGTANFNDASNLAIRVGNLMSQVFGMNIKPEALPDGRLSWSIANEVIKPEILKGYDYTASYFNQVQEAFYNSKHMRIKGAKPDKLENRLQGFLDKLTSDEYENVKWILEDPAYLVNYLEAVVDTGIKNNVGMLGQAGIRARLTRTIDGNACPWCVNLAGDYDYGDVPDDIYRRHRDCHCKVTYSLPDGFRQDVWSKKTWDTDDAVERRKQFEITKTKLSPERARELEQILTNQ